MKSVFRFIRGSGNMALMLLILGRLAHEVKNPLTPIRLAAERLQMKLTNKLDRIDGALLDKAASTIVAQVEALRTLVDAFGDYAREPVLTDLNQLIREVVALYQQGDANTQFDLQLDADASQLKADAGRLRQLLHNLLRNNAWDTWWRFTPRFFTQFLEVLGFTETRVSFHRQPAFGHWHEMYTIVAARPQSNPVAAW